MLSLYSDGAFEIERPDGSIWPFGDFVEFMEKVPRTPEQTPAWTGLIRHAREIKGVGRVRRRPLDRRVPVPAGGLSWRCMKGVMPRHMGWARGSSHSENSRSSRKKPSLRHSKRCQVDSPLFLVKLVICS